MMAGEGSPESMASYGAGFPRNAVRREFNRMCESTLPTMAREYGWSVRLNHCFRRICYDLAVGQQWDEFVEETPAYKNMALVDLVSAYSVATTMALCGEPVITVMNEISLMYRKETDLDGNQYVGREEWVPFHPDTGGE